MNRRDFIKLATVAPVVAPAVASAVGECQHLWKQCLATTNEEYNLVGNPWKCSKCGKKEPAGDFHARNAVSDNIRAGRFFGESEIDKIHRIHTRLKERLP
jgi:hypothetical protein